MNCKYKKIRTKKGIKYGYCTLLKKEVNLFNCRCNKIEYKNIKIYKQTRSKTITKLEKNRKSLFTNDLDHCIFCGNKKDNLHEVFFGKNRLNSMEYSLVIPLCIKHHLEIHKNHELDVYYKVKGQELFEKEYPHLNFLDIFKSNYK